MSLAILDDGAAVLLERCIAENSHCLERLLLPCRDISLPLEFPRLIFLSAWSTEELNWSKSVCPKLEQLAVKRAYPNFGTHKYACAASNACLYPALKMLALDDWFLSTATYVELCLKKSGKTRLDIFFPANSDNEWMLCRKNDTNKIQFAKADKFCRPQQWIKMIWTSRQKRNPEPVGFLTFLVSDDSLFTAF